MSCCGRRGRYVYVVRAADGVDAAVAGSGVEHAISHRDPVDGAIDLEVPEFGAGCGIEREHGLVIYAGHVNDTGGDGHRLNLWAEWHGLIPCAYLYAPAFGACRCVEGRDHSLVAA